ncbi:hypothetical protein [Spiroplasma sp. SV19]|uniref:hypothetical protein n=1 Tax=Spiroplasma sp. SV19 TaxID=2570468 RepID=UPI0024B86CF7|nr:hypothetical protein [Spiroplasma sp. SV19]WHQ37176.1 hypothetical protein E7Y35_04710 [Spiroplasma sp. SV19]
MGLVKNLLYAIYDVNDDLVGIYESVEEVVINYYKVDPDNPLFEIKKKYVHQVVYRTKKQSHTQSIKIYCYKEE